MSRSRLVAELEERLGRRSKVKTKETSKSWVFLTADRAFKLKKPIRNGLQDLTPLCARHHNALTEVDLNRRLAPGTYIGLVRVGRDAKKALVFDDPDAETIDWLVEMHRLPAHRMLDAQISGGAARRDLSASLSTLVQILSEFYRTAPVSRLTAAEFVTVLDGQLGQAREVLLNSAFAPHHPAVTEIFSKIAGIWPQLDIALERRVHAGVFVEGHGDLRPEHICLTERPVIFDCLEFNRTLRLVDPYSELAFLGLECAVLGADWIGPYLIDALEPELGPRPGSNLSALYEALHAILRARLCLAHLLEVSPRTPEKWAPLGQWYLETANRRLDQALASSLSSAARAGTADTM